MFYSKTKIVAISVFVSFCFIFSFACQKAKTYSEIPYIEYLSSNQLQEKDALGNLSNVIKLQFSFVDGDGDLGLLRAEMQDTKKYNIFVKLLEKKQKQFVANTSFNGNYRFSNISKNKTNNKVIKGKINCDIFISKPEELADTCKLEFYIVDRAGHFSNTELSEEIIFPSKVE